MQLGDKAGDSKEKNMYILKRVSEKDEGKAFTGEPIKVGTTAKKTPINGKLEIGDKYFKVMPTKATRER